MNRWKENKGMTLVALILAIIILLALAGTAVYLFFGPNGTGREIGQIAEMQDKRYAKDMVTVALKAVKREEVKNTNNETSLQSRTNSEKMESLLNILGKESFSKESDTKVAYTEEEVKYIVTVNFDNYTVTNVE